MNLHHLELFYYVARHGGISRAVRHIPYGIQQPAVSTQILALEQDLGAKLFDRQPFRLTAEGQELYQFAEPFFAHADEVCARVRGKQAPKLRVAAAELVLRDHWPAVIAAMKAKHPAVRFALRTGFQAEMEDWLHEGLVDLAITPLDQRPQAGLKRLPIVNLPLVLLVPKASPLKSAAQLWAQERIDDALISLPADESITRAFQKGLKEMKIVWPTSLEAPSPLIPQYVANGYGLGVTVNLPGLVQHPQVRVLPLPGFAPVEIAALWRPPTTPLLDDLLAIIASRARALWPA